MIIRLTVVKGSRAESLLCAFVGLLRSRGLLGSQEYVYQPGEFGAVHRFCLHLEDVEQAAELFERIDTQCGSECDTAVAFFRRKAGLFARTELLEIAEGLLNEACRLDRYPHLEPFALAYPWVEPYLKDDGMREALRSIAEQSDVNIFPVLRRPYSGKRSLIVRIHSERRGRALDIPFRKVGKWYVPVAGQWNVTE